jgi:type IV pilus assembly protein PilP
VSPRYLVAILASIALAACGSGKMADLEEYVQQVKQREPGPIEPLPEIKQIDTFVFEPGDRRDPFVLDPQSAVAVTAVAPVSGGIAPDPLRRKEELEGFSLDSLKMMGTMEQGDTIWALVASPQGTLYHVRVGNYVGMNNGQITRITEEEIELTEIVSDGAGEWRERRAAIALSQ